MPLAEIFVGASIKFLLDKLSSGDLLKFARREGIHAKIKRWEGMLLKIEALLSTAENQQSEKKVVRLWLDDLQDLAYDLDDMLDEFATEEIKRKLDGLNPLLPTSSKVNAFLPRCCTTGSFSPSAFMFNHQMKLKMEDISTRLAYIFKQSLDLNLEKINRAIVNNYTVARRPTTSLLSEPRVCGRDREKKEIIEYLQREEEKLGVLPIVGMGGIGKTTLSQTVYNDKELENHFDLKAWVCVSEEFDLMRVTKSILESITRQCCSFTNLDSVQVELKKELAGKKFLIILDDVWNESYGDWNVLKSPFSDGAPGSKVVVTTRLLKVASTMETVQHHIMQPLSVDACWSIFAEHAFGNRAMDENPNLIAIGRKIVDKCKGLPLAARTIGGLLRCKEREDEWGDVLNSKIWWEDSDILPALRLSYLHLPAYMKPCFAYCAIIPKDYEFTEKELVLLWMAEGFVQQETGEKQMEDVASDFFQELFSRSLFQLSSCRNDSKSFVMHDLVNDLARIVSGGTCIRLEGELEDQVYCRNPKRIRYSSYVQGRSDDLKKFKIFHEAKHTRTFLPFSHFNSQFRFQCGYANWPLSHLATKMPLEVFPKLKFVRALSLRDYSVRELPDSVGDMKHMRYLDLSFTLIEILPRFVQTLYNLQTLMLIGCSKLQKLPADMGNLVNLRLLDVTDAELLREMPLGIGKMKSLGILSDFIITEGNGNRAKELGKLKHLGGSLCISGLQNIRNALDAKEADLVAKEKLDVLKMKWGKASSNLANEGLETKVLEMLKPHQKLKELQIDGYQGTSFPFWLGDPMFANMVSIKIANCSNCSSLPPLGQLYLLKRMYIQGMERVKHVGLEFYGKSSSKPFPVLEILHFKDMPEWEEWFEYEGNAHSKIQPFARVNELLIAKCPKLRGVVDFAGRVFPSLTSLSIDGAIVPEVMYPPNRLTRELTALENLNISCFPDLRILFQKNNQKVIEQPPKLPVLRSTQFDNCPQLVSIFELEEEEEHDRNPNYMKNLESIYITCCEKFNYLLRKLHMFTSLVELELESCPMLISFPETGFPSSLRRLGVYKCEALQSPLLLSNENNNLVMLFVADCPSLPCLTLYSCSNTSSGLPRSLTDLTVWSCSKLEALVGEGEDMKIDCPVLTDLNIGNCPSLKCLPSLLHDDSLDKLKYFGITGCKNLEFLPHGWLGAIIKSRTISIVGRNKLKVGLSCCLSSLTETWPGEASPGRRLLAYILKEGSIFTKLNLLRLNDITIDIHPSKWALHRLPSLRELEIQSPIHLSREETEETEEVQVSIFPLEGMLLPTSLTILKIIDFPDLQRLSSTGFECLSLLETLLLEDCPKLAYFPKNGLPSSLLELEIWNCPILATRCEKQKGQYWTIISHIPYLGIGILS